MARQSASRASTHCELLSGSVYDEPRPEAMVRLVSDVSRLRCSTSSSAAILAPSAASAIFCLSPDAASKLMLPRSSTAERALYRCAALAASRWKTSSLSHVSDHSCESSMPGAVSVLPRHLYDEASSRMPYSAFFSGLALHSW